MWGLIVVLLCCVPLVVGVDKRTSAQQVSRDVLSGVQTNLSPQQIKSDWSEDVFAGNLRAFSEAHKNGVVGEVYVTVVLVGFEGDVLPQLNVNAQTELLPMLQ
jgi:hypothetical protein